MLLKLTSTVFVAGQPGIAYRPYSKSCPPPPPPPPPKPQPKRWVTKRVCGTVKTYAVDYYITTTYGGIGHGQQIVYELPGLPTTTVSSGLPYSGYQIVYPLRLLSTAAYCKMVTVYE